MCNMTKWTWLLGVWILLPGPKYKYLHAYILHTCCFCVFYTHAALWSEDGDTNCKETVNGSLSSFSLFAHRNRDELFAFSISARENPYPSKSLDWRVSLPTVYLPGASSVGSMHQNPCVTWCDFSSAILCSHRGIVYVFFLLALLLVSSVLFFS